MVNLANAALHSHSRSRLHPMDYHALKVAIRPPHHLNPALAYIHRDQIPSRHNVDLLAYDDIFVDDFLVFTQVPAHPWRCIYRTLLH